MNPIRPLLFSPLLLVCSLGLVCAQSRTTTAPASGAAAIAIAETKQPDLPIIIHLVQGGQLAVDEVNEESDGVWYKRGNISTFLDRTKIQRIEHPAPPRASSAESETAIQGEGKWHLADAGRVKDFFLMTFNRPLPLTAFGQSELHNRWGWDHRNGMDIGLHPDSVEGRALIAFLRSQSIPFMAFRGPIPGIATGPHIHVGNRSPRLNPH